MESIDSEQNMNILEDLNPEKATPSLQFKNSLRSRVISDFKEEPAEGRFFFNERTINYLSIFIVIISIGIVAGAGVISFNNGNKVVNVDSVAAVPAAKKPEILEGIIKNNPDALIVQTADVVSEDATNVASVATEAQKVSVSSEVKGYNFSFTKASTEFGKNIDCSSNVAVTKDIFTYSDNETSLYRVINLDANDDIVDSVQVETNGNKIVSTYSRNGEGQIIFSSNNLEKTPEPASFPVSSPQVTTNNIDNYFDGESQDITEVTKDGEKFYVLDTQGDYDCNGTVVKAVFKNWFTKDDFSLFKKEIFKTNSSEINLIERTTFNVVNQQVEFETVKQNFLVADKENSYDISELDTYQTLETLLNYDSIIIPGGNKAKNLKISNFQDISLGNRLFYKDDQSYFQSINTQPIPYARYNTNGADVSIYDLDVQNDSIFSSSKEGISQDIRIGDNFYTGELFVNTLPVSFASGTKPREILVVEIDGLKYVFSSSNLDSIINIGLDSKLLSEVFYANKV